MDDILEQCLAYCKEGKCMSGDTCAPMMHGEPCYGEIADELTRLRAEVAEKDAEIERLREALKKALYWLGHFNAPISTEDLAEITTLAGDNARTPEEIISDIMIEIASRADALLWPGQGDK